jgi:hypothetical protein
MTDAPTPRMIRREKHVTETTFPDREGGYVTATIVSVATLEQLPGQKPAWRRESDQLPDRWHKEL